MLSCIELPVRARRHRRGAAMVEGVMVVSFLAMTFVLLVGIGGLYKAKLLAAQDARFRNVYNATNNCTPEGSSLGNPAVLPEEPDTSGLDGNLRRITDVSRLVVHGGGLSRIAARKEFAFGPTRPDGTRAFSHAVTWRSTTACNEAPQTPDALDVVKALRLDDLLVQITESIASVF